jgi:hypothetical protein
LARILLSILQMREDRATISAKRNNETKKENQIGKLNMNAILEFAAFRRERKIVEENFVTASDLKPEPCVALVTGGAVLGFDDRVHIDLDRAHTVLSLDEARQFAAELNRIADAIDPFSSRERGE